MTCLEFGLNVAPLIMKAIISMVLSQYETVGRAASMYIEDIFINEDVVPAACVREHLAVKVLKLDLGWNAKTLNG